VILCDSLYFFHGVNTHIASPRLIPYDLLPGHIIFISSNPQRFHENIVEKPSVLSSLPLGQFPPHKPANFPHFTKSKFLSSSITKSSLAVLTD
jgi:hypothetical protein